MVKNTSPATQKIKNDSDNCFETVLSNNEAVEYQTIVKQALNLLNKENLAVIIHGASFPSTSGEDTGVGSMNSSGAKKFIRFIEKLGFNSIQLGPDGKTKSCDASPYVGTIFSTNTLLIDLTELTTPEWAEILSQQTFKNIVDNNPNKDKNKVAYSYIFNKQNQALEEAYNAFIEKLNNKDKAVTAMNAKFTKFKEENKNWLDCDALYEAIGTKHNNDYWPAWKDDLDKNLFSSKYKGTQKAQERIAEIESTYKKEIEAYKFYQFIANEQKNKTKEFVLSHDVKTMADIQVAFSDRDFWACQSLFLPGYYLGCPPDLFSADGQAWGFPVMDPEKLYNPDGSLGEGGKLLKYRFDKVFQENPGGARIDHAVGLVDPWVYQVGKSARPEDGGSRLFSSPDHHALKKYSRIKISDLNKYKDIDDPEITEGKNLEDIVAPENELRVSKKALENQKVFKEYCKVVDIVLQSAKDNKVRKDFIIFEDLGTITNPVIGVMQKLDLSGIRVTQFVVPEKPDHMYRGKNVGEIHWITAGTHDNMPLSVYVKDLYKSNQAEPHIKFLAEDLAPVGAARSELAAKMRKDQKEFIKAKFVELFVSPAKNVQIFFNDIFGIDEPYNKPGTAGDENWSLRLPNNFKQLYFEQLAKNTGLNLPEILKEAIEAKGQNFVKSVMAKNPELMQKLEQLSSKLKAAK